MGSNDTLNYLAGNPILINIFTGVNASGRYRIYSGINYTDLIYDGCVFSISGTATIDVSELFKSMQMNAGVTIGKMVTVDGNGVEYVDTNNNGNSTKLFKFKVFGGGISKALQRKLTALNTDIFAYKLKVSNKNFFLTTRTNGPVISIPEDELLPLYYYAPTGKFYVTADGITLETHDFTVLPHLIGEDLQGGKITYIYGIDKFIVAYKLPDSTWDAAIAACDALSNAGYNDWRLPTLDELELFVLNAFNVGLAYGLDMWSSTVMPGDATHARTVRFSQGGNTGNPLKSEINTVWAIRDVEIRDSAESLQSIDFAALRSELVTSDNKLVSVFDITTDTSYSCSVMIIESQKRTEYFVKFRNSWGSWEKIALQGDVSFTPAFSEVTQVAEWDTVVNDFVTKNKRKEVLNSFNAGVGYRSEAERLFVIDMMISETVILIANGLEYPVNVSGELPTLVSTTGVPTDVTLKIDFVDKETNFSDLTIESEYEVLATMTLEDITSGEADIIV